MSVFLVTAGVSTFESALKLLGLLVLLVLILVACYYTTRFVGVRQLNRNQNQNFKIIETCRISQNKYLQLIKAGNKYLVIAVCKDSVTYLAELNEDQILLPFEEGGQKASFWEIMLHTAREKKEQQDRDHTQK